MKIINRVKQNRKIIIVFGICISFFFGNVSAQIPTFTKGDNVVNFGIGFGGSLYSGYGVIWGDVSRMPAFTASYEHGIVGSLWDDNSSIGLGGLIGYSHIKWKRIDYRKSNIVFGVRGALHYTFVDKLDTYAGLMFGISIVSDNRPNYENTPIFVPDCFLGARYYFADNFAAFAELGIYVSFINMGVSLKF